MRIRKVNLQDFPELRRIYRAAREFMRTHGNPNQWGNTSPEEELLLKDIRGGNLYLVLDDGGHPAGAFALFTEPDPTYSYIERGSWLSATPYTTIHSIASDGTAHGVLRMAVDFAEGVYRHVRIDTHEDNIVMQTALEKLGFSRRGIIYLANGDPRIAYEKI
ncbi:MAG: N-acetyltransferase [Lachnospiraceae bacterium]|nr:N-acetyltransferase [Lachnospiraceae bacterium]